MARILVSDDDPQVLRLVSLCLEHAGYDVLRTSDPHEVAELASAHEVDAIVLDVMMPGKDGFEVLSELRGNAVTAGIPILFLSGRATGEDRVRGLREGADDFLAKPFEPEELELRIERLVAWGSRSGTTRMDESLELDGSVVRTMDRYEVREVLGQGTMGTVFRGWDPRLKRAVALKTIRLDLIVTESQRHDRLDRLKNEAVTVARFNHPNIVGVYDMGDLEDTAFIAMELVEGISLSRLIKNADRLPVEKVVPLALGVVKGLAAAHERNVIHRDVKPQNVLLGLDGAIKVTDFGVAHIVAKTPDKVHQIYGTPGYVPPESLRNEPYTAAGDLFGFGVTIYEALAGEHPLVGGNIRVTIQNTLSGEIRDLADLCPDLPAELAPLVMRSVSNEPADRPTARQATDLLTALASRNGWSWSAADLPPELLPPVDEKGF